MAKVKMGITDTKKVKIYPKKRRFIGDLLKKNGRIEEPKEMELNAKEITRAMSNAIVTEEGKEGEEVLNPLTYNLMEEKSASDTKDEGNAEQEDTVEPEVGKVTEESPEQEPTEDATV